MMSNKRARIETTAAEEGAEQVGQGLQVTKPTSFPHLYNNNYTVQLTYADNYRHDIAQNGSAINQVFRTNNIFDVDYTGGGHQPMARDLWASMYDYYTVLACKYKINIYNASGQDPVTFTAAGTSGQVIGAVNVTTIPTTDVTDITNNTGFVYPAAEVKNTRTYWLIPGQNLTLKGTLTPGDFMVDAKDSDADTTWTANGSNPAAPRFLGYIASAGNYSALTGVNETPYTHLMVQVILQYTVQFTQINPTLRQTNS
ncbi:hypothetical protein PF010_g24619 [Phytophthora fragariae]|uniref:Capsid protein n=2 Tax=Phytophthora fragariae TaxID=53985 RepID=A0A6G0K2M9_9STRA|nr:hypothetical protein PF010_g24619 [Phytophthora fragariae]